MLLSCTIEIANYTASEALVIGAMSRAFFAKGFGNLGWCVLSDTSPKEIPGIAGGVFNMCGNLASIVTPLVIGVILSKTGSFDYAILSIHRPDVISVCARAATAYLAEECSRITELGTGVAMTPRRSGNRTPSPGRRFSCSRPALIPSPDD